MGESEHPRTMRLQRFLARAGAASRRGSEDLMTAGRVRVNGVVVTELGSKVEPDRDVVTVDGIEFRLSDEPVCLVLNKPAGYLTTMSDPHGRRCVSELVPTAEHPGLFPVGRLDADTTGVLLFTTDGDLAQALLHPSRHVEKTYLALVEGRPGKGDLDELRRGIVLDDGPCKPAAARVLGGEYLERAMRIAGWGPMNDGALVELRISEGRKHQVKRMLEAVGHPVLRLHRQAFGPVTGDDIPPGSHRMLGQDEMAALRAAADNKEC